MDSVLVSFNIVAPMFLMFLVGVVMKRLKVVEDGVFDGMNRLNFMVFLPLLLFYNAANSDFANIEGGTMLFIIGAMLTGLLLFFIFVPIFIKDNADRSVVIHAMLRANSSIYGVTLAVGILGEGNAGNCIVSIAVVILLYNLITPVLFAVFQKQSRGVGSVLLNIVKNPLFIGCVLGLAVSALKIDLPVFLTSSIKSLSNLATPLAFICLGASFSFSITPQHRKILAAVVPIKLIVLPVLWILVGLKVFNLPTDSAVAILVVFGPPTAVSSYTIAKALGANYKLAGEIVVFTTVCSIFTLFVLIAVMKHIGLA